MSRRLAFNFWTSSCTAASRVIERRSIFVYFRAGGSLAVAIDTSKDATQLKRQQHLRLRTVAMQAAQKMVITTFFTDDPSERQR
jgi:hypothetical protein